MQRVCVVMNLLLQALAALTCRERRLAGAPLTPGLPPADHELQRYLLPAIDVAVDY